LAIYREDIATIELSSGSVTRSFLNHTIGKGDNLGNRFGVRLVRDGQKVSLSGCTCQAVFMAPNGQNILISGSSYTTVNSEKAYVKLPQACYNTEGRFTLSIKLIGDGVTGTMRIIDGVVCNTGTDGAVAPVGSVPTYQEVLASYDDAIAASQAVLTMDGAVKAGAFQFVNPEAGTEGKYWNSSCTLSTSVDYIALDSFHVEAGTYYMANLTSSFCWLKKDADGTIMQITGTVFDLPAGDVYISGNFETYPPQYWVFSNVDIRSMAEGRGVVFPYGLIRGVCTGEILDADYSAAPRQFLRGSTSGHYWTAPGTSGDAANWYRYEPVVHVPAGLYYINDTFAEGGALTYCWLRPDDGTADLKLRPYNLGGNVLEIPKTGTLYMSAVAADGVIGTYVPATGERPDGYAMGYIGDYKRVTNSGVRDYLDRNSFSRSASSVTVNDNVYTVTVNDTGVNCGRFSSSSNLVRVQYDFDFAGTDTNARIYIQRIRADESYDFVNFDRITEAGKCYGTYEFDAASWNVYANAVEYRVTVRGNAGAVITMNKVVVFEADTVMDSPYYENTLDRMLLHMSNAIEAASSEHDTDGGEVVLRGTNGEKRGLIAGPEGLTTFPYIPAKWIAMGNSITCGYTDPVLGKFGMASTAFTNDWVARVKTAINALNSSATYERIYASPLEHCETIAAARAWIEENESSFTADVDLVIIEIGDNVNNDTKRQVFTTSWPELLHSIRTHSPHARIIVAGIWFSTAATKQIITTNCAKYGAEFVDINGLRSETTEATAGDTIHYSDGTTGTISAGQATHPGDKGMQAIAEAILKKMAMTDA